MGFSDYCIVYVFKVDVLEEQSVEELLDIKGPYESNKFSYYCI